MFPRYFTSKSKTHMEILINIQLDYKFSPYEYFDIILIGPTKCLAVIRHVYADLNLTIRQISSRQMCQPWTSIEDDNSDHPGCDRHHHHSSLSSMSSQEKEITLRAWIQGAKRNDPSCLDNCSFLKH